MKNPIDISILRGPQFYAFSDCYLDTVERRLFKKNRRLEVTPKALEVLQVLVENAGEVVSKDELLGQIWGESFVEEGNLPVQISKLRSVLGANKDEPYIVTESGVGYKFVSRVRMVDDDEWSDIIENELSKREDGKHQYTSIAIMPLLNENGDEEVEYLAEGITESLINSLSRVPELRVIARNTVFQFKDKEIDIKKLGRRLRVATILTGRVRLVRDNLVIGVELSKVSDGTQIWGTQLNEPFDDIFEVQENISEAIGSELRLRMISLRPVLTKLPIQNDADSYKLLLKGRYFSRKGGTLFLGKAIECFQQSISLEPTNGDVYLALAHCYLRQHAYDLLNRKDAIILTQRMLDRAERLNGAASEILYLKGLMKINFEWEFSAARKLFEQSLKLNPESESCSFSCAMLYMNIGRVSDALYLAKEILRIDPVSVNNQRNVSRLFYKARQHEEAIVLLLESLEFDPNNYESLILSAANFVEIGRIEEAKQYLDSARKQEDHPELLSLEGYMLAKSGNRVAAKAILKELEDSKDVLFAPTYKGVIYSELGEFDSAFKCLEDSIECRQIDALSLSADPRFSRLRHDRRFNEALARIGIPTETDR